jgi:hypothetical protein
MQMAGRNGVGALPNIHHRDRGPRVAFTQQYLAAENRILRGQLKGRLTLSNGARATLGEIGHRLACKAPGEVATAALPGTEGLWLANSMQRMPAEARAGC